MPSTYDSKAFANLGCKIYLINVHWNAVCACVKKHSVDVSEFQISNIYDSSLAAAPLGWERV